MIRLPRVRVQNMRISSARAFIVESKIQPELRQISWYAKSESIDTAVSTLARIEQHNEMRRTAINLY